MVLIGFVGCCQQQSSFARPGGRWLPAASNTIRARILLVYSLEYASSSSCGRRGASMELPYAKPRSNAFKFNSREEEGTESATALRTESALSSFVTAVKKPTMTELSTMRFPSSSAKRVAGTL